MGPHLEGPNIFLLILGLVLNSLVMFCHGGRTSSYVRRLEATVDMPRYSDVFRVPPGFNAPQHLCSSWIRADRPSSVKEGSLRFCCCAQPDHNPTWRRPNQ
ncbi:unnamed protein product [Brassica oleracea var. botrytis]